MSRVRTLREKCAGVGIGLLLALTLSPRLLPAQGHQRPARADTIRPLPGLVPDLLWQTGSHGPFRFPFTFFERDELRLKADWFWEDEIPDTLYFYFEGVGRHASCELNGIYLGNHGDPFYPWLLPVAGDWIRCGKNDLRLNLDRKLPIPGSLVRPFCGAFRSFWILRQDDLRLHRELIISQSPDVLRVGWVAPLYGDFGLVFDEFEAVRMLLSLKRAGIQTVYFPFEPGEKMKSLCLRMGMRRAPELREGMMIAPINAAHPQLSGEPDPRSWLDPEGGRGKSYGVLYPADPKGLPAISFAVHPELILLALLPLLVAAVLGGIMPGFLAIQTRMFAKPRLFLEMSSEFNFTSNIMVYWLLIGAIMCLAAGMAILFFSLPFVIEFQEGERIGLAYMVMDQSWGPLDLFLFFFVLMLGWLGLKFLASWVLESVFRIRGFARAMVQAEVVSSFPLLLLVFLPMAFSFGRGLILRESLLLFTFSLLAIYWIRKAILFYKFLGFFPMLSLGVKYLYICSLILIPYLIWF